MKEKDLLRAVYTTALLNGTATVGGVASALAEEPTAVRQAVGQASQEGLVELRGDEVALTAGGRGRLTVVMLGGAFEIIHPGHIHTISESKKLGDTLVLVVAADGTVAKNKGRNPVTPQELRVKLVSALRAVDAAVPGGGTSIYDTMQRIRPDIVALGYDQWHNPKDIEDEAKKRGMPVKVVRLSSPLPGVKTSKILSST